MTAPRARGVPTELAAQLPENKPQQNTTGSMSGVPGTVLPLERWAQQPEDIPIGTEYGTELLDVTATPPYR